MIDQPCTYCGAKAGHPCSGYGLVDGDMHEARLRGTTKASDVVDLGRARALLGCSSEMSLLDGVCRMKQQRDDLVAACETWLSGDTPWSTTQAYEMAARAVAKAKGGPCTG